MPSIRRSLLGYLLLLLALGLGAVGTLVDRFANGAIRQREASEEDRIGEAFKIRRRETAEKFDADLMAETKAKANEVQQAVRGILGQLDATRRPGPGNPPPQPAPLPKPLAPTDAEISEYFQRRIPVVTLAQLGASMLTGGTPIRGWRPEFPGWVEFAAPLVFARIGEALHRMVDDDHIGFFQFTLVRTQQPRRDRAVAVVPSTALGVELPLGPSWLEPRQLAPYWLEPSQDLQPKFETIEVPGKGKFRQVVTGTYGNGRAFLFGVPIPPPATNQGPYRGDFYLHVFVQHARPFAELDAQLAADQKEEDEQLARIREETRMQRAQLGARLVLIGSGTFAALVLGGWVIVARGLAPLRILSDAVSRVSEKDFRLPVVPAQLGHELAPIHARLTQTLTLLQRAFAREKQAVADISHELRTPIAALLATIDVALRKPRTPDQYRNTLEECRLISRQLGQLVERIMTLASLDAGNDHTHVVRTDATELAGGCAAVIRPLAAANNLTVSTSFPADLVLDTDPAKLREVLMNLLHNAVEYNRPGGAIELIARRDGAATVFEVRDTGIGMTADVRDKIFERFYRADPSRQATGVHAGLGLAIVKEYVSRLGGTIAVESEPGSGTTFRVTLPPSAPSALGQPGPNGRPKARDVVAASS